ncbi:MAG: M28 family metallopeptidase [Planctomycetota bacterium]
MSIAIEADELSDHVHFLAQPALKGRKPQSWGSRLARNYITKRFKAYDLKPWATAKSYKQSFVLGTNVIGVLPGSDPNLSDEYVIVSAHYDHLGKTNDGMCPGACDNASGVAALLEIAEQFSLSDIRPKRSICFAAFDQEEGFMFGALAFTCRPDFDEKNVVGVVNIDHLGRNGFEVLENHLIVSGTEGYAPLREKLLQNDSDLHVLPIGTDIVGARGDHVAFETMDIPVLFFTCGSFRDYHKPSDTADKLDYVKARGSTQIVSAAVSLLADTTDRLEKSVTDEGRLQELSALQLFLDPIVKGHETLGWTQDKVAPFAELSSQLEELKQKQQFDPHTRRKLILNNLNHLISLSFWPAAEPDPNDYKALFHHHNASSFFAFISLECRPELIAIGRGFIDHINRYKARLILGMPDFELSKYGLRDHNISLVQEDNERYRLRNMPFSLSVTIKLPGLLKWSLWNQSIILGVVGKLNGVNGTHNDIMDGCLLMWRENLSEHDQNSVWQKTLSYVTGLQNEWTYDQWLQWHLDQGSWSTEEQWLLAAVTNRNPYVTNIAIKEAWKSHKRHIKSELSSIITDEARHGSTRKTAIEVLDNETDRSLLLAIAQILDNTNEDLKLDISVEDQHSMKQLVHFMKTNQEKDRELAAKFQKPEKKQKPKVEPKTLGDYALKKLKELTKQDFGQDKQAWITWIKMNY